MDLWPARIFLAGCFGCRPSPPRALVLPPRAEPRTPAQGAASGRWRGWAARRRGVSFYDSTFSRTVWRLYGGAKGLVMWYYLRRPAVSRSSRRPPAWPASRRRRAPFLLSSAAGAGLIPAHSPYNRGAILLAGAVLRLREGPCRRSSTRGFRRWAEATRGAVGAATAVGRRPKLPPRARSHCRHNTTSRDL